MLTGALFHREEQKKHCQEVLALNAFRGESELGPSGKGKTTRERSFEQTEDQKLRFQKHSASGPQR